jgi:hypothetical protein
LSRADVSSIESDYQWYATSGSGWSFGSTVDEYSASASGSIIDGSFEVSESHQISDGYDISEQYSGSLLSASYASPDGSFMLSSLSPEAAFAAADFTSLLRSPQSSSPYSFDSAGRLGALQFHRS